LFESKGGLQVYNELPVASRLMRDALSPSEELTVAMQTVSSFLITTQHADLKASAITVVYGSLLAVTATQVEVIHTMYVGGGAASVLLGLLLALQIIGFIGCGYHLAQSLRPRAEGPKEMSRFAFPLLAKLPDTARLTTSVADQADEAWRLARHLAEIARTKYKYVTSSLTWLGFTSLAFLGMVVCLATLA
jgi:hypothetical protein